MNLFEYAKKRKKRASFNFTPLQYHVKISCSPSQESIFANYLGKTEKGVGSRSDFLQNLLDPA
jgi:hypothetical protein